MTESEWLASSDPKPLLESLKGKMTERKLRLFSCACCRRIWPLLPIESRRGVEVSERYADGLATISERDAACDQADAIALAADRGGSSPDALAYATASAVDATSEYAGTVPPARSAASTAADAAACAAADPADDRDYDRVYDASRNIEVTEQANLIRDIFGNLYQNVTFDPSWLTPTVVGFAQTIYDERTFDRMPELADRLETAGCKDNRVLVHCRGSGQHIRGCWVVDLILGKDRYVTAQEKFGADAASAVQTLRPLSEIASFGFNRDSVAWVEGYIEHQRIRSEMSREAKDGLISVLGAFLGECIIHCYGGKWRQREQGWGILFDNCKTAYTFSKVRKQFDNGVKGGDSILSLFDAARSHLDGHPMPLDLSWLSPTVILLAHAIENDQAFERMPELARALEAAGCTNADILAHCRNDGPHVRGCWAIHLLLTAEWQIEAMEAWRRYPPEQLRVPAIVFGRLLNGELRITLLPGIGLADGDAPRDVPIDLVPAELRLPNTKLWVQLNQSFDVESITSRIEPDDDTIQA